MSGCNLKLILTETLSKSKNVGYHFETWKTGVLGPVVLHGLDHGKWDLTWAKWSYQVCVISISIM